MGTITLTFGDHSIAGFRRAMARIPGITEAQAKAMATDLRTQVERAEHDARTARIQRALNEWVCAMPDYIRPLPVSIVERLALLGV